MTSTDIFFMYKLKHSILHANGTKQEKNAKKDFSRKAHNSNSKFLDTTCITLESLIKLTALAMAFASSAETFDWLPSTVVLRLKFEIKLCNSRSHKNY